MGRPVVGADVGLEVGLTVGIIGMQHSVEGGLLLGQLLAANGPVMKLAPQVPTGDGAT